MVSRFISGAGAIFGGCTPRASISPIQYNGKAKKGKLESMFQLYLKQRGGDLTSSFQDLVKGLSDGDDGGDEGGATESDAPAAAGRGEAEPSPEEMADLVGKIQYLFDINANKREKIEQRIMREAVMSLGSGGKGSLEDMVQSLVNAR